MMDPVSSQVYGGFGTGTALLSQYVGGLPDLLTIISALVGIVGYGFWALNQYRKSQYYADKRKKKK